MKTLINAQYHAQRIVHTIPNRRPVAPTGSLVMVAALKIKDNTAFFHHDANGNIWQSYAGTNFRNQHIYYSANLETFYNTAFNAGWYSRGAIKWSPIAKPGWLEYIAKRAKVTASGYTSF